MAASLAGLDEVDWSALTHAYGPASDIPGLIRDLCSDDAERAGAVRSDLFGSILHHQGTVYPATVAAVPFLVDAARQAHHGRADLVVAIGMLADPHHAYGPDFDEVRTAVLDNAGRLSELVDDGDDEVRRAVVYLAAQTGAVPAADLAELWDEAEDPELRIALLMALAGDEATEETLAIDWEDEEPEVVLAAALALQRAGRPWPDETADALVDALDAEADLPYEWHADDEPTTEVVLNAPEAARDDLLRRLLATDGPGRETALWILTVLFQERRSARERFVPLLGPLLAEQDARKPAVDVLRHAGRAAGRYRDELAAIATGYPAVATSQGFTIELYALQALTRLGDARWVAIACEGTRAGGRHHLGRRSAPFNASTLAAFQTRLDSLPTDTVTEADHAEMKALYAEYRKWEAVDLVPRLRELAPAYGSEVARFLVDRGDRSQAVLDRLRVSAEGGGIASAVALWRATGDATPVVSAVRRQMADNTGIVRLRDAIPAGAELGELAEDLRRLALREAPNTVEVRLIAAHLFWTATGESELALEIARRGLGQSFTVEPALELIRLTGARHLADEVRAVLDRHPLRNATAVRTLWQFGTRPEELLPRLYRFLEDGYYLPAVEALDLIVEMSVPQAAPVLLELADRDKAIVRSGLEPDIVWNDEDLASRLRAAAETLAATR